MATVDVKGLTSLFDSCTITYHYRK